MGNSFTFFIWYINIQYGRSKINKYWRNQNDDSYRYKMPALQTRVEGKGNGVKTRIINMVEVSKSLRRPPSYPTKFFGCEVCASSKFESKTNIALVNGAHDQAKMQQILMLFVEKFVLCPTCKLPETDLIIDKQGKVLGLCRACGAREQVDNQHKLCTFIMKHPPPPPTSLDKQKNTNKKGDELMAEKGKKGKKKGDEDEAEVVWFTDTSKKAMEDRRNQEINPKLAEMISNADDDIHGQFKEIISSTKDPLEQEKLIRAVQKRLNFGVEKRTFYLCDVLFDEKIKSQLKGAQPLLARFIKNQKTQRVLLGYFEEFFGEKHPTLMKQLNDVLMGAYDLELIEEETFFNWGAKKSKYSPPEIFDKVLKQAQPFITWLKEADEDDSDDEDESSDEE